MGGSMMCVACKGVGLPAPPTHHTATQIATNPPTCPPSRPPARPPACPGLHADCPHLHHVAGAVLVAGALV